MHIILRASLNAIARRNDMHGYYGSRFFSGPGYMGAGGFPWIALITWVVGLAVAGAIIYFAIQAGRAAKAGKNRKQAEKDGADSLPSGGDVAQAGTALEILAARFARGEITRDEYLDMKETLGR